MKFYDVWGSPQDNPGKQTAGEGGMDDHELIQPEVEPHRQIHASSS